MLKKLISILLLALLLINLTSCGDSQPASTGTTSSNKLKIVATIFPIYDWAKQIAGDYAEVEMLISSGVDLHSFQPSVDDIITISDCDVFIYVGGTSDTWTDDVLAQIKGKKPVVVSLMDVLANSIKEEELVEGMQEDPDEHEEDHHHTGIEYDEHVWLSLKNAGASCEAICDALSSIDKKHSDQYKENYNKYFTSLHEMDEKYFASIQSAKHDTVLFGDRFPFRYLTDDYGIKYYAAFVGCSAESEASFETIIFLANKVDELSLSTILIIETSDGSIAETIRSNTSSKDQKILTMDSMQSCTKEDVDNGLSYLQVMESNLSTLLQALS